MREELGTDGGESDEGRCEDADGGPEKAHGGFYRYFPWVLFRSWVLEIRLSASSMISHAGGLETCRVK